MMTTYRYEKKYLIDTCEAELLSQRVSQLFSKDPNSKDLDGYHIRSIYFDTEYNQCLYENEAGTEPRSKWRIRTYNCTDDNILLECKTKIYGLTSKESCSITLELLNQILAGKVISTCNENTPLLNRFLLLRLTQRLKPAIIVCYDRKPLVYPIGNVRLTIDSYITASTDFSRFFDRKLPSRPILPVGREILELKYDHFLPGTVSQMIELDNMRRVTFSKYYLCRKFNLLGE